jgi:hypothetical protein
MHHRARGHDRNGRIIRKENDMRRTHGILLAGAVGLAGCAAEVPTAPEVSREAQVRACAVAVADHVGLPPESVTATWRETTGAGTAWVAVRDGDRLHTCEVDEAARVLQIRHPGA